MKWIDALNTLEERTKDPKKKDGRRYFLYKKRWAVLETRIVQSKIGRLFFWTDVLADQLTAGMADPSSVIGGDIFSVHLIYRTGRTGSLIRHVLT